MTDAELVANVRKFAPKQRHLAQMRDEVDDLCDRLTARNAELAQAREEIRRLCEDWRALRQKAVRKIVNRKK